jgi:hypothetical protein
MLTMRLLIGLGIMAVTTPAMLSFPNVWPAPICKWIFASLDQSAVMYPAPEHSLWP